MRGSSARVARKAATEAAKQTEDVVAPVLLAAQQHSFGLQKRIADLEDSVGVLAKSLSEWQGRSLLGRLRWVFRGR